MRRTALITCLLAGLLSVPAAQAHGPETHGADPAAIDRGAEVPRAAGARARGASSTGLPTRWCGDERATNATEHELANGDHRYHAVYAVPADAPSRLTGALADQIQTDAMRASSLIEQLYGRAVRYDMGSSCGSQYIDISVVRLAESTAEMQNLAGTATGTLDAIARALDAHGFPVIKSNESFSAARAHTRNWMVWLDAPGPSGACGQAMLYNDTIRSPDNFNNLGGKVAAVFRDDDGFCGPNSVRHEIAHNLGAVVSDAPNSNGGHCTDALEDTMCLPSAPTRGNGAYHGVWFDYGNDDYWDPPSGPALPWWTVNLSRFICPDATCNVPPGYAPPPPPAQPDTTAGDSPRTSRRRARVSTKARRYGDRRWRLSMRVRSSGRALVSISCRTSRRARSSTVWSARVRAPRTIHRRVRCASRPRVVAWIDASAENQARVRSRS
jgi:hypothetical protein